MIKVLEQDPIYLSMIFKSSFLVYWLKVVYKYVYV
jgi:hypothetical protein